MTENEARIIRASKLAKFFVQRQVPVEALQRMEPNGWEVTSRILHLKKPPSETTKFLAITLVQTHYQLLSDSQLTTEK